MFSQYNPGSFGAGSAPVTLENADQLAPIPWNAGLASAVPQGLAGAVADTASTMAPWYAEGDIADLRDWARPPKERAGTLAKTVREVTEGLTLGAVGSLAGLPGITGMMGSVYGHRAFDEVYRETGDYETAMKVGLESGAFAAAGALVPASFSRTAVSTMVGRGLIASEAGNMAAAETWFNAARAATKLPSNIAFGAATNAAMGGAQRFTTGQILDNAGYPQMAANYRVMDNESVLADLILGGAFGAYGHLAHSLPSDVVDEAINAFRRQRDVEGGFGISTSPDSMNADERMKDSALASMIKGEPVSLEQTDLRTFLDNVTSNPNFDANAALHLNAMADDLAAHGGDYEKAATLPGESQPQTEPTSLPQDNPAISLKANETEGEVPLTALGEFHRNTLATLAANSPDAQLLIDEKSVLMKDLPEHLANMELDGKKLAPVYDDVIQCFLQNGIFGGK